MSRWCSNQLSYAPEESMTIAGKMVVATGFVGLLFERRDPSDLAEHGSELATASETSSVKLIHAVSPRGGWHRAWRTACSPR